MRTELLIIDPQVDFCDPRKGKLYVNGAERDMERLAAMIGRMGNRLDGIHVTLDSHHFVDIAHPIFWIDAQGDHPPPFTVISVADVETERWTTTQPAMRGRALDYVNTLGVSGRYALCIWPPHCLIGSAGHAVMPELFDALTEWEERFALVDYVAKGASIYTEHYSAVRAEAPDPDDPSTQTNTKLIQNLMSADVVAIAGEAGSHCVANTVRDIADAFNDPTAVSKLMLLTDATSPVAGFEAYQKDFIKEMTARGMRLSTTAEFLLEQGNSL